ncbi:hypothetical protein CAPTEDRAFT_175213 [Capitella teleta]|uniref:Helicase ATP-binding domain-containing protein n=1 Tax=Capitella teleta TaxID=283909 RepID=R7UDW5_CAPTE|nr:hypothetical protein CAPTEDRAFT_175213 [Capitella teleta]|eukprot:ELU04301.1 hypothetical protein CAPTEDRAFT_175213 [Capitella teleta]
MEVPAKFAFPFEPYGIQEAFMHNLYSAIEGGQMGIFESPTGTGKSLSLICGALTWLQDYEEKQRNELEALLSIKQEIKKYISRYAFVEPDWVQQFVKQKKVDEELKKIEDEKILREKREARLEQLRGHVRPKQRRDKRKLFKDASLDFKMRLEADSLTNENGDAHEDEVILEEYHSDDESLLQGRDEEDNVEDEQITKIFYCSRTHSQLTQFVREVQKSPFGESTHLISLGSRQNTCINEAVKRLSSLSLINDRCLEMQRSKSEKRNKDGEKSSKMTKQCGCPFYKQDSLHLLKDRALIDVQDIEQLVTQGKQTKACPYYSSRLAVPAAQIVVLPYQMLLHKSTRESCGVKLKGQVVIIDEAHNLLETISNIHSTSVNGLQLTCAYSQLSQYQERYHNRLKAKNLMYIRQILFILSAFIKVLGGKVGQIASEQEVSKNETRLQTINDFLFDSHLDNLNLFKVVKYCQRSKISMKLNGFMEKYQPQVNHAADKVNKKNPSWALSRFLTEISQSKDNVSDSDKSEAESPAFPRSSPLMQIESFLEALTNSDRDGRIVITQQPLLSNCSVRFILLNPSVHFSEIIREARAVILAGGTMQPVNDFKEQLFKAAGVPEQRIREFSCGHVIPPKQLLPIALARGSSGTELDFTYQKRDQPQMMSELGRVIYNVCNLTPGGVVCFFPSYELERTVHAYWEKEGFLNKMAAKKKIFREPRKSNQVDRILREYSACIERHASGGTSITGAVMFCVVGGKMSEGINFSDNLCRCVVMVGLPYPNIRSPELKEKMEYLNATMPRTPDGQTPGQLHYENLCMKAVNQSIGRAIRHQADYAAILLLDQRYLKANVQSKLPSWICKHLQNIQRFGPTVSALRKFFADNQ